MRMHIKDHYKTLGLSPVATSQDIKKAYRRLAFEYHPDQNPDNAFAEASFKDIQEAYAILSNTNRRRAYDEERWLMGMSNKAREKEAVTPHWILHECKKLSSHMAHVDTYRMSHRSLRDYVLLLLSDAHIGVLKHHNEPETNAAIIKEILASTRHLEYEYMAEITRPLLQVSGNEPHLSLLIANTLKGHKRRAGIDKYFTFFILSLALLLAIFMYFYGRKT